MGHYMIVYRHSVLIHGSCDYETYAYKMARYGMPVKYYQRHLRTFTANSKFLLSCLCDCEIDFMIRKSIFVPENDFWYFSRIFLGMLLSKNEG